MPRHHGARVPAVPCTYRRYGTRLLSYCGTYGTYCGSLARSWDSYSQFGFCARFLAHVEGGLEGGGARAREGYRGSYPRAVLMPQRR